MNEDVLALFLESVKKNLDNRRSAAVSINGNLMFTIYADPATGELSAKRNEMANTADEVIDYLNSVAGTNYRHTKTNRRYINARIAEGYTIDDFRRVIDSRWRAWQRTSMQEYMRPATLFNSEKFDGYLNAINVKPRRNDSDFLNHTSRSYSDSELSGIIINLEA